MDIESNNLIGEINSDFETYNPILDHIDSIFVVVDEHYIIRLVNKKACEVFGYKKDEMEGKLPDIFVLPSNKEKLYKRLAELFNSSTNPNEYTEFPFITKNGREIIIRWHNSYLRDNNGKIVFVLKSGEDVTEKKRKRKYNLLSPASCLPLILKLISMNSLGLYIHQSKN